MADDTRFDNWLIEEDCWSKDFSWFLIDEGQIQYAFKSQIDAETFQNAFWLSYMLLTNSDRITDETMLDPGQYYCWSNKLQRCVERRQL